jgi:alpha-ketoglutarate-dependent taurine dioxygenase
MTAAGVNEPLLIEAAANGSAEQLAATARDQRQDLAAQLLATGALLFRGFNIRDAEAFGRFVNAFSGNAPRFGYAGGASPRRALDRGRSLYNSTEYPENIELALHNELSYVDVHPRLLFFCCITAPRHGGATTLGDSRRILASISPDTVEIFRRKRVRYVRNLSSDASSGYSWQNSFETDDPAEMEAACRRIGAIAEWRPNGYLRVTQVRPATALHPDTREEVWFNQADGFHPSALDADTYASLLDWHGTEDAFRLNVTFGDGRPIERYMLDEVRRAIAAERVEHHWQSGDVLVLDNFLMAHGRAPFSGPRKIVLAMI